ncbi:uracil-DNA glycosylase [Paenibacillus flagellatus]|uniref:uracil-DNA glycosylase n=1 Tax=Paenibacillus flagellatus TaxID=2211139 RepID=UPI001B880703|nr:uracil-DNA glycosylase [Paenibacillus flagellatus]
MAFEPIIFPEERPPEHAALCDRCELSGHRNRVVWGEGNPGTSLVVLLDNPGARENREGVPFVCGTRETLQQAAAEAGFRPDELYVTYVVKCRPRKAYDKPAARRACSAHLSFQLMRMRPKLLFCLGNVALQSFLGDPEAEVKTMRGSWIERAGMAVAASYHPLAVRRRPVLYAHFLEDWRRVAARYRAETAAGSLAQAGKADNPPSRQPY